MDKQDLYVSGFPKSGNSFTARLLGDVLDSPVTGYLNAHPIAEEGLTRPGPYTIRQLHLRLSHAEHAALLPDAWTMAAKLWHGERVVFIIRDPRDVSVSVMHYWQIPSLNDALQAMFTGSAPLVGVGSWKGYVTPWLESNIPLTVRYEDLVADTLDELCMILNGLGIPNPPPNCMKESVLRQSFGVRRAELEANGDRYNYGKEVQLRNMRKGTPGDWQNCYTRLQAQAAEQEWGELLRYLGYEMNSDWWKEIR